MRTPQGAVGAAYNKAPCADDLVWQLQGLCNAVDPVVMQPEDAKGEREAKFICRQCPVVTKCAEHAILHHEQCGVWGALSEGDRRRIWRQMNVFNENRGRRNKTA